MNVAYLCADRGIPVLGFKGASVHVREMVCAFARTGHEVTLFCTQRGAGNPAPPGSCLELPTQDDSARIAALAEELGVSAAAADKTLRRELERLAQDRALPAWVLASLNAMGRVPDLLYERYSLFHRAGVEIAAALGIPHILEVNAPLVEEQAQFRGLAQRELAERTEREVFARADHVVAVSAAMKGYVMRQGVPEARVTVLPNGVDGGRFHPGVDGRELRARHGLGEHPVIGFVGSLKPWHGIDLLLDAFRSVRERHPEARLLVVGDGPAMDELRLRAASAPFAGSVELAGHVAHGEVPAYLAAMDVTVAPYQPREEFYFSPMKVIESMAAGRPVVAPRIGQIEELVRDGVEGRLYRPGDTAACAAAVCELLDDAGSRREMGRRAAHRAHCDFAWEANAERVAALGASLRNRRRQALA